MKGKYKVLLSVVICLVACLFASICLFAAFGRKEQVALAFGSPTDDYSLWDSNTNTIFSVEKVAVEASKKDDGSPLTETKDFTTPLYTNANMGDDNELDKMYIYNHNAAAELDNPSAIYYDNIRTGNKSKTVVYDNDFVMLNNQQFDSRDGYYNESLGASYKKTESGSERVNMQEAVLVSFGNYFKYLDNDGKLQDGKAGQTGYTDANGTAIKPENAGANIEWIRVNATRTKPGNNTAEELDVPGVRTYKNDRELNREDFAWIIPQTDDCEGYYQISVNFKYNGMINGFSFGFYIILGNSYYGNLQDSSSNIYNSYPALKNASEVNGVNHFYMGENDLANNYYPTLSYDVTKYEMDYVHTANGVTTTYALTNRENGGVMSMDVVKTSGATSYTYTYPLGRIGSRGNIAVVVFTELGNYQINFRYKYNGAVVPNMNLTIDSEQLVIHGFELKYAKAGYNEAEMRHLTFANNANSSTSEMGVGLIVPNGYRKADETANQLRESELGLIYDYDETSPRPVGTLISEESAKLKTDGKTTVGDFLNGEGNFSISFAKTNQGSLWLTTTDKFVLRNEGKEDGSYYYFAQNLEGLKSAELKPYTNTVSFNQTGYYLVFIKVDVAGTSRQYYSVFAFQYTADTVTVHTEKVVDGENTVPIASGAYTNKDVKVWWEKPGTFEREIRVEYFKSADNTYPSWQQLATTQGTAIESGAKLGSTGASAVAEGNGALFLIKLQSVGKSASFRTFIIDRQPISGVQAYAVESKLNRLNNVIYTTIKDENGNNVALVNGISDSYVTLDWASKENLSGAKITATYTRTAIIPSNSAEAKEVGDYITTKYALGATVGEMDHEKPNVDGELTSASVLFESGIYLFTLTDEAGNSCKYMFVIDKTENYFKITEKSGETNFVTRENLLFTDGVDVKVGKYKAIELTKAGGEFNDNLFDYISGFENNNLNGLNYYSQTGTNSGALSRLFKQNGSTHYLAVENRTLNVYNNQREFVARQEVAQNNVRTVAAHGASYIEQLYLVGENQITLTNPTNSSSYVIIEINTDHALGMAYYGSSIERLIDFNNLTNTGENGVNRLYYDNDYDEITQTGKRGIAATHATGADYLAFSFKLGTGTDYEVKTVSLKYYQLNLYSEQGENFLDQYFYADEPTDEQTLYNKDATSADLYLSNGDEPRAVAILKPVGNKTVAGLYVISREYVNDIEGDGEKDKTKLDYYYIVDRNGVIVASGEVDETSINGGYISIGLKDNEMRYSEFNTVGVPSGTIRFMENNQTREIVYNVYLTTNRLPAILNIPVGKYFYSDDYAFKPKNLEGLVNGTNYFGSEYFSGRLAFDLYFNDTQGQLDDLTSVDVWHLFSLEYNNQTGYYTLNLAQQNMNNAIKTRFVGENGEFIKLPGDYVLVVRDNVEGVDNVPSLNHQKVIGIRLTHSLPNTTIYSAKNKADDYSAREKGVDANYNLVTNKEFVILDMQNLASELINGTQISAELDLDYLKVTQTREGVGENMVYIDYDHGYNDGINIDDASRDDVVWESNNGKTSNRKIWLNTYLRDENGNIFDYDTLSKNLSYIITIRFNVVDEGNTIHYENCYYYYDSEGVKHQAYERSYTIKIDRVPPQANTNNLVASDSLAKFYTDGEVFENTIGNPTDPDIYFVKRYKDYYFNSTKDASKLYAFHVNANTPFVMDSDLSAIYTRRLDSTNASLSLPVNLDGGDYGDGIGSADRFGDLGLTLGGYYEIVEEDFAGNITQYIVYYDYVSGQDKLNLDLTADVAQNGTVVENSPIRFNFSALENESYTIFDIKSCTVNSPNDLFYIMELSRGGQAVGTIKTNFATNFAEFGTQFVSFLTESGYGNYNLTLRSSQGEASYTINYLDRNNIVTLLPERIIKRFDDGRYYFDLAGANETIGGITYYAKQIEIQGETQLLFDCRFENGEFNYYLNGERVKDNLVTEINGNALSGSYKIVMTDIFGKTYNYNFNTEGKQPYEISFGENGDAAFSTYMGAYYSFDQANLSFDNVVYGFYRIRYTLRVKGSIKDLNLVELGYITETIQDGRVNIVVKPYFEDDNKTGAVLEVVVELYENENALEAAYVYNVNIDTTSGAVALRDNALDGANRDFNVDIKFAEADLLNTANPTEIYSGLFYLSWTPVDNEWFNYNYYIYEEMLDGTQRRTDLNGTTNFVISTQDDSTGIYRFVVEISNEENAVLGYKVYTFAVQPTVNEIYSVRTKDNKLLMPNSRFKFNEIGATYNKQLDAAGSPVDLSKITGDIPLYVYNDELVVDIAKDIGAELKTWSVFTATQADKTFTFKVYRVRSLQNTYSLYFGTLIAVENDRQQANLISNLQLVQNDEIKNEITSPYLSQNSNKFYGSGNFKLTGEQNLEVEDASALRIIYKNCVVLSVWCNGEYVKDFVLNNNGGDFSFDILGSGLYTFTFKDLAGNVHNFNHNGELDGTSRIVNELELVVLREITLKVNGLQAVNNTYYNGRVQVDIFRPSMFYGDTRFLNTSFTLNGEKYEPIINQYSYTFTGFGTYKLEFSIRLNETFSLSKTLTFTIVNENEAMQSFDLTPLYSYKITKLTNNRGESTNAKGESLVDNLNKLLNARQEKNKYLLTYEFLQENSESLSITTGKQKLTINYLVDDGIYAAREIEFSFTLNNQIPNIECNVEPGGSTKSSFTITYTPSVIYDYVGDSELYINDILVCKIDASSAGQITPQYYTISFDANGAGDYYVVLRGTSGAVHTSFKITVKEPLNTWSIIVIVVVVAIVLAIVGTIIFLRKRMKIR